MIVKNQCFCKILKKKLQLAKIKRNQISDHLYSKIRSRGGQPGQLYDLAKIQKGRDVQLVETPARYISILGSSYDNHNKRFASLFENIDKANNGSKTKQKRRKQCSRSG